MIFQTERNRIFRLVSGPVSSDDRGTETLLLHRPSNQRGVISLFHKRLCNKRFTVIGLNFQALHMGIFGFENDDRRSPFLDFIRIGDDRENRTALIDHERDLFTVAIPHEKAPPAIIGRFDFQRYRGGFDPADPFGREEIKTCFSLCGGESFIGDNPLIMWGNQCRFKRFQSAFIFDVNVNRCFKIPIPALRHSYFGIVPLKQRRKSHKSQCSHYYQYDGPSNDPRTFSVSSHANSFIIIAFTLCTSSSICSRSVIRAPARFL